MLKKAIAFMGIFVISCTVSAAGIGHFGFLTDSVVSKLDEADVESFRTFAGESLNEVGDMESVIWEGHTGVRAKIQMVSTYLTEGELCRAARFAFKDALEEETKTELYRFHICQDEEEKWSIASTPASNFTDEDWALFDEELDYAMDNATDGSAVSWANENTGASGVFVPLNTEESCRSVAITIFDRRAISSSGTYILCENEAGLWRRPG